MKALAFVCAVFVLLRPPSARADTVALWLFDEQVGVYPSSVLNDAGPGGHSLILGRGAEIAPGKFGNALWPVPPAPLAVPVNGAGAAADSGGGSVTFVLRAPTTKAGRTQPPLTWENAHFAAMSTNGDTHLRRTPYANATDSKLNLGGGDWTIECWLWVAPAAQSEGVIFEIGAGPRGENDFVTRFSVLPGEDAFALAFLSATDSAVAKRVEYPNPAGPPGGSASVQTTMLALNQGMLPRDKWVHVALVHAAVAGQLRLLLDGKVRAVAAAKPMPLPHGDESYVSIGRDGRWRRPLGGAIDELRISDHVVYPAESAPPSSFARAHHGTRRALLPLAGPSLLFGEGASPALVLKLGSRRHLFPDAALLAARNQLTFTVHPPRVAEAVIEGSGRIPYANGPDSSLALFHSKDGVHFTAPDLGHGAGNGYPMKRSYIGYGLVRRGRQLWQYSCTRSSDQDAWKKQEPAPDVIHQLVQRVDGFISLDALYTGGTLTTKPLRFTGNRPVLNVDMAAAVYSKVGFIEERGAPVPGFSVDESVDGNGDEIDYEVEWLARDGKRSRDVSVLAGKPVQLLARLRDKSLYTLQLGEP